MKFIELDLGNNDLCYLNIAHIIMVKKSSSGTQIIMSDQNKIVVVDDIDSVKDDIDFALDSENFVLNKKD